MKEDKYIELVLDKCLNFDKSNKLFIYYEKALNENFVNHLSDEANKRNIIVHLEDIASYKKHDILKNLSIDDLASEDLFNSSIWDEYANENAAFLIVESEIPGLMDDIDINIFNEAKRLERTTKPIYRKKQAIDEISWLIIAYPNEIWANEVFPNSEDAYQELYDSIMNMCLCDYDSPISKWEELTTRNKKVAEKLNMLNIRELHYTNSLGTDLYLELPNNYKYDYVGSNGHIVNMPSYEVFSSPHYLKTHGIVYSSKPLNYNGCVVDEFNITFMDGKAVACDAKVGKEVLEGIINGDQYSCYLGECALVNYDSPISNMKTIFNTTLIDENASCHLALGAGFPECIENGLDMTVDDLRSHGINDSSTHVDFMIGTSDLSIVAKTVDGREVVIFEDGNFTI